MKVALAHNLKRSDCEEEAEFDTQEAIDAVAGLIAGLGHIVAPVEVSGPVSSLIKRLERFGPDLVFNLAEGHVGRYREAFYPALFEQLGLRHTGSGAGALALAMDKALSKKVLGGSGVTTPRSLLLRGPGALARLAGATEARALDVPLIVKPNHEGSSKGITQKSVVEDPEQLVEVVAESLGRYPAGILVEEFIDGVDVGVAWVDGLSPETGGVLAPAAYRYQPSGRHRIYDLSLKRTGLDLVEAEVPAELDSEVMARLVEAAAVIVAELGIDGYGRVDFRVTPGGAVYFLEMNPLPSLAPGTDSELYRAAALLAVSPADVLACIVDSAVRQSSPTAPPTRPAAPPRTVPSAHRR